MTKIKILIVDDEPLAHSVLEGYCKNIDYIDVVGNCYDGISALNFLNKNEVDAILLDIQMPDLTGLELLDSLKHHAPKIIFTTAFTEYAFKGFNYDQVVDYLHKPVRLTRFIKALERLKKLLMLEREHQNLVAENSVETKIDQAPNFIILKDNKTAYRILMSDIIYIQSWGNYLKFFLTNDDIKIIRKTIKKLESELPEQLFTRIHKSYMVNIKYVAAIQGNQIIIGDQKIPIGKSYIVIAKKVIAGI